MVPLLAAGGKLVFMHKWDPERAMQLIERERINSRRRADHRLAIARTSGVRTIRSLLVGKHFLRRRAGRRRAGARIKEKFPRVVPGTGWGMTEVSGGFTGNQAEDYELRPESCGPAIPVGDMKIVDADGNALPTGGVGELWVKGPNVVRGYWQNPQATAETFIDGWLRTGDIARLDEEGFCSILDRAKDMLIRGGENIYCVEVENALYEHPAVIDAAVVGIPHAHWAKSPARW